MKKLQKPLSILLVMTMIISLFTMIPFEVGAAKKIKITKHHWDNETHKVVSDPEIITQYTELSKRTSDELESGYYVVTSNTTVSGRLYVADGKTVGLYLGEGATLTVNRGIRVDKEGTLDIYAAKSTSGKLYIHMNKNSDDVSTMAAIGSNGSSDAGEITIHGGTLDLRGDYNSTAAIIGGGNKGAPKRITIWDGDISCMKQKYCNGAGIGGGYEGKMSWGGGEGIRIYGGKITTDTSSGAGIGSGARSESSSGSLAVYGGTINTVAITGAGVGGGAHACSPKINIYGGKVTGVSVGSDLDDSGAGIGSGEEAWTTSAINISGGTVFGTGEYGAGIGAGARRSSSTINITGDASVVAISTAGGAGIGGGREGNGGTITISGEKVHVTAVSKTYTTGDRWDNEIQDQIKRTNWYADGEKYYATGLKLISLLANLFGKTVSGAGVGGGYQGSGGTINIKDGCYVNATSGKYAAGIGGGDERSFDSINISGSTVIANGGDYGAGIGTGDESETGGTINITNGADVTATGGTDAAGIGTGNETDAACTINISDSKVVAHGGRYGAGIGGGDDVSGGTISITNSTITADSATDAAGIGGGEGGHGGTITITGSTVKSTGGGYAAGIGGGDGGDGGTITITGSAVHAYGGVDGAGIGGGEDGSGGHIEIIDSEVHAYGSEYGSGIGGGENEGVSYVRITGESTVEAVAGGDGNSVAIGNGDYSSFWNSRPSSGTLSLHKDLIVDAGANSNSTSVYTGDGRFNAIWNHKYARIYTCPHSGGSVWRYTDSRFHTRCCSVCGRGFDFDSHEWNAQNVCTVCGATAHLTTLTFVERDNNGEIRTELAVPDQSDYPCPECTKAPDGYEFVCWKRVSGDYYVPGEKVDGVGEGTTMEALYLPLIDTKYIDANGTEQTVKARRLNKDDVYWGMSLTSGWYVIEEDMDMVYETTVCGEVNLIIADGATLTCLSDQTPNPGYAIDVRSYKEYTALNLYGQSAQTGTFITGRSPVRVGNFAQYGGIVKCDLAIIPVENLKIGGGQLETSYLETASNSSVISGGNISVESLDFSGSLVIGFTKPQDSITIGSIPYMDRTQIIVAEGQKLTDDENVYEGTLTSDQLNLIQGKTLKATLHDYGEPRWIWSNNNCNASAFFTCRDCGEVHEVKAKVSYEDSGRNRTSTARCVFYGEEYTATKTVRILFDITVADAENGTVTADRTEAKPGDHIELTVTPDEDCRLISLYYTDHSGNITYIVEDSFEMPESDVTVTAVFRSYQTVEYLDEDGEVQTVEAVALNSADTHLTEGWYFVSGKPDVTHDISLSGNVKLILCDDAVLNMPLNSLGDRSSESGVLLTFYRAPGENEGQLKGYGIFCGTLNTVGGRMDADNGVSAVNVNVSGGSLYTPRMDVTNDLSISGGTVIASNSSGAAVNCEGDMNVSGGSLSTKGSVNCSGSFTVLGGTVDSKGTISCTADETTLSVLGGSLTVTGDIIGRKVAIEGGNVEVRGEIRSSEDITLAWATLTDSITAVAYSGADQVMIPDGMKFTDGTTVYSGVYRGKDKDLLGGKTLTPSGTAWEFLQYRINHVESGGTVTLSADVEATSADTALVIPEGKVITLDLNGCKLDRHMTESADDGNVITNNGILTITDSGSGKGGVITGGFHNTAGGGITNNGILMIEGGAICGNNAYEGGGISNAEDALLILSGGTITGNDASSGGGIYFTGGTLCLSGSPVISGNTASDSDSDLFINGDETITIVDKLSENARIGIRKRTLDANAFTSGLSGVSDAKPFFSNHPDYGVRLNADGEAVFKLLYNITEEQCEHGRIIPEVNTACEGDEVILDVLPDDNYIVSSVTMNGEKLTPHNGAYSFTMPDCDITLGAAFTYAEHVERVEPYVNSYGSYVLGNVEYYVIDGRNYAVNADGTVGKELSTVTLSYFTFSSFAYPGSPYRRDYQINYYTGPTEDLTELVLPGYYDSRNVSIIGNNENKSIFPNQLVSPITLVIKGNPLQISSRAFLNANVTKVTGSNAFVSTVGDYAFGMSDSSGDNPLEITFDRNGSISAGRLIFENRSVTLHLSHNTHFSTTDFGAKSLTCDFTDGHTYGEPEWSWADDLGSAAAAFTCTHELCGSQETLDAEITREQIDGKMVFTATVECNGKTYTDQKELGYVPMTAPYIDENDAYILGTVEHYEIDGKNYAVAEDGSVGGELSDITLSYFDFNLLDDGTWQIMHYTGPIELRTELVIPKTFDGRKITVLGSGVEPYPLYKTASQNYLTVVLNENITELKQRVFIGINMTCFKGDTSGLNKIGDHAFQSAGSPRKMIEAWLEYPGTIHAEGTSVFSYYNEITLHLRHATTFDKPLTDSARVLYIFTDDHTYGEPVWTWSDDLSTASATFPCTTKYCRHSENVKATITREVRDGKNILVATAELGGKTYTDEKEFQFFVHHSLSLNGDIGVNFYVNIPTPDRARDDIRTVFSWKGNSDSTKELTVPLNLDEAADGYYKFTCNVCAAEMNDVIEAKLYYGDDLMETNSYSVKDYAAVILNDETWISKYSASHDDYAQLAALVKTMLNYDAAAQTQFDHNADKLVNEGLDYALIPLSGEEIDAISGDIPDAGVDLSAYGLAYYGYSLLLKTQTTLRFYFKITDHETFDPSVITLGPVSEVKYYKTNYVYIELTDIAAKKLGETNALTVGETRLGDFSALSYVKDVLTDETSDKTLTDAVTALYRYHEAAEAFF